MNILSVEELTKQFRIPHRKTGFVQHFRSIFFPEYEIRTALDHVTFSLDCGECVGYIGPNGAGKSTTVKILSGILYPDHGEVRVFGTDPSKDRMKIAREIGVVFGQRTQLWWDLPVRDSFQLLRRIYSLSVTAFEHEFQFLVETLNLASLLDVPVRQLSLGQRMRCDIAASLIHAPRLLFLDEPTIGLDAVSKLGVRDCIRQLNKEKKVTIFLTTHDLDDIEALCQRVLVLNKGKLFFDGSLHELRKQLAPERRLIVDLVNKGEILMDEAAVVMKQEGHRVFLSFNPETTPTTQLIQRITSHHSVKDLFIENTSIEEVIAKLYRSL